MRAFEKYKAGPFIHIVCQVGHCGVAPLAGRGKDTAAIFTRVYACLYMIWPSLGSDTTLSTWYLPRQDQSWYQDENPQPKKKQKKAKCPLQKEETMKRDDG